MQWMQWMQLVESKQCMEQLSLKGILDLSSGAVWFNWGVFPQWLCHSTHLSISCQGLNQKAQGTRLKVSNVFAMSLCLRSSEGGIHQGVQTTSKSSNGNYCCSCHHQWESIIMSENMDDWMEFWVNLVSCQLIMWPVWDHHCETEHHNVSRIACSLVKAYRNSSTTVSWWCCA